MKVGALKANNAGRFQLAVAPAGDPNFVNVGSVTDTYASSPAAAEFDLGTNDFTTAGGWQFRFTVPSKNGSSSDYDLTLDYIRLTPIACEPLFTWLPTNQSVPLNTALAPTLFMAEDDFAAGSLVVTATSSNPALVPNTNLAITGGSPYYTLAATPLTNRAGTAVISLIASDGTYSTTNSFRLTVGAPLEAWRTHYFSTVLNTGDAADSADPDRDNRSNLEEYVAGTNPKYADMPPLLGITQAAGQVMVSFTANAASGPGYTGLTRWFDLFSATNLPSSIWPGVPGCTNVAGSNQLVIHTNMPDAEAAYYHLQIRLQ